MAEAPEQATSVQAGEPATGAFSERADPIGPLFALPGSERESAYRPLSLLAIAGFSLAVVYAVSVTAGGLFVFYSRRPVLCRLVLVMAPVAAVLVAALRRVREPARIASFAGVVLAGLATAISLVSLVAFSSSNPWFLPNLMWVLVIVAAAISWVARMRIQASEDTLSGADLAKWGLYLSLFFGINYAAYLASSTLAVRGQARQAADDFLTELKKGDTNQAFLKTLHLSARPPEGVDLRDFLEASHNTPRGSSREMGPFSAFRHSELVRLMQISGAETAFEAGSVTPTFENGVHRLAFNYKLHTPRGTFEALVTTIGVDDKDTGRRLWHIDLTGTALIGPATDTQAGADLGNLAGGATAFVREWNTKLRGGALDGAYLSTVDPAQREAQGKAAPFFSPGLLGVAGNAPLAKPLTTPAGQAFREGRQAFRDGALLDTEGDGTPSSRFWASSAEVAGLDGKPITMRDKIIGEVRQLFAGTLPVPFMIDVVPVRIPLTKTVGDRVHVSVTCKMMFMKPTGPPDFQVEALIIVEMPPKGIPKNLDMRIHSLQLLRGGTMAEMDPRQRR